jgi:hypothetical protein
MNVREELVNLAWSDDSAGRIAELDEGQAKDMLAVAIELLRDGEQASPLSADRLGPSGFF